MMMMTTKWLCTFNLAMYRDRQRLENRQISENPDWERADVVESYIENGVRLQKCEECSLDGQRYVAPRW